jgi:uncharacterized protein DUF695
MEERTSTDWTVAAGRFGAYPAELRLRSGAFERELGKPEYSTAVVVQIMLNDPNDDGLPTVAENNELADVENTLGSLVAGRGLLVSVITALGLRQLTWYADTDWTTELLERIGTTISSHGVRVLARADPQWRVARQLLD